MHSAIQHRLVLSESNFLWLGAQSPTLGSSNPPCVLWLVRQLSWTPSSTQHAPNKQTKDQSAASR